MSPASVTCLVVSRTPALLNRFLASLEQARRFWGPHDTVLCSWNGSAEDEVLLASGHKPHFHLAQRNAYHFAANMNGLAAQATGNILAILNDDLILDPGSLDQAIQILCSRSEAVVVGARLRTSDGRLSHAGILFNRSHRPYNRFRPDRLGHLIDTDGLEAQESGLMPAVTGALMVLRRSDFEAVRFRETFRVCGEDVALCLDLQQRTGRFAYYASDVTAIHDEKSTRGESLDHYDLEQVAQLAKEQTHSCPKLQACLGHWTAQEADLFESLIHELQGQAQELRRAHLLQIQQLEQQSQVLQHNLDIAQAQLQPLLQAEWRRQRSRRWLTRVMGYLTRCFEARRS